MRRTKHPQWGRRLVVLAILFVLSGTLALGFSSFSRQVLQESITAQQAALIGAVIDEYPHAEQHIIRQVKQADETTIAKGEAVLSQYGLSGPDLIFVPDRLETSFQLQTALFVSLAVLIFVVLTGIFFLFVHRQNKEIGDINNYLSRLEAGENTLDIRDNTEGELSILKNELYKMTTMLKEQTENLKQDKIHLADSLADISHQLKTPLTSLIVIRDLLADQPSEEVKAEFLERMKVQLKRMEWLTTSLLKLSRLETGTVTLKKEKFHVQALIDRAVQSLSIPVDIKQHRIRIAGDESVMLTGDIDWMAEALINILKNHIEHTPEQGIIRIEYEDNPIFTKITTADNGQGIHQKDLPYIFNRFYRGKNASEESVGIGLAMAYEIVKQQGGDITVKSESGEGTEFTLTFYKQHI